MTTRLETQLGPAANVNPIGTTYTNLYTSTGVTTNISVNIANVLTSSVKCRLYVADGSWASGAPATTTLIGAVVFDYPLAPGASLQVSGIVMASGQKLIAYADTASGLHFIASGVVIS